MNGAPRPAALTVIGDCSSLAAACCRSACAVGVGDAAAAFAASARVVVAPRRFVGSGVSDQFLVKTPIRGCLERATAGGGEKIFRAAAIKTASERLIFWPAALP